MRERNCVAEGKTVRTRFDGFSFSRETGKLCGDTGESKNCEIEDGVLSVGMGGTALPLGSFEDVYAPDLNFSIRSFFPVKLTKNGAIIQTLAALTYNGEIKVYDSGEWKTKSVFGESVRAMKAYNLDGNCVYLVVGENGLYLLNEQGGLLMRVLEKGSKAACFFQGRLFVAKLPDTIMYSAPYEPTDFTQSVEEAGDVKLPLDGGSIVAIKGMQDKLFIFYEYGILEMGIAGSARAFSVKKISYNGGKILSDSVGVCATLGGEKAFFLAQDGLYVFNGKGAKRVCKNLDIRAVADSETRACTVAEGKYCLQYEDEKRGQRGVIVDVLREEGYFSFACEGLQTYDGHGLCVFDQTILTLQNGGDLPQDETYTFSAFELTFGTEKKKLLKELSFVGRGEAEVWIGNGKREKRFLLSFNSFRENACTIKPMLRGEKFTLRLRLEYGTKLYACEAVTEVCQGVKVW